MSFEIQQHFFCENCKICGSRPVIDQKKTIWTIMCPNESCKNAVVDKFINIEKWNIKNKVTEITHIKPDNLKHTG